MADKCPRCGKGFKLEWENEKEGKLSICVWCLADGLAQTGVDVVIEKREGKAAATKPASRTSKKKRK